MFMDEDMFANETDAYTMGFLIMQALTDPSVLEFVRAYIMEQQKNSKMMDPLSNLSGT